MSLQLILAILMNQHQKIGKWEVIINKIMKYHKKNNLTKKKNRLHTMQH